MSNILFKKGDVLVVQRRLAEPQSPNGLCYDAMVVTVSGEGKSGGWEVFTGVPTLPRVIAGKEISFYGFSVIRKLTKPS